jgi:hypothetical protein
MVAYGFVGPLPLGHGRHHARGVCGACYQLQRRAGAPRHTLRREVIVEETAFLARQCFTRAEIADRLGVKPDSLYQAHRRAGVPCPV